MKSHLLLGAALLAPVAALGQEAPVVKRIGVQAERSRLSNGYADWTEGSVRYSRQQGRQVVEAAIVQTRRFNLDDTQLQAGFAIPLSAQLTASAEAAISATHHVVPRHMVGGRLQYELAPGWLVHGGARYSNYDATDVTQGIFMVERYVGNFSLGVGWNPVRALDSNSESFELRGSWFYRDDGSLSLIASRGDEATTIAAGAVALVPVRSVALIVRQRVAGPWSLTASAVRAHQGSFYTRTGASVGVQREF